MHEKKVIKNQSNTYIYLMFEMYSVFAINDPISDLFVFLLLYE